MGGMTEKAHEYGLRTWCEPYAHSPFPANSITYGSAADEVAAEFWVDDKKFRKKEVDAALWSARRSGKNRVWAESFTDVSTCAAVTLCCSWAPRTTMPPNLKLLFPMAPERYGIRSLR